MIGLLRRTVRSKAPKDSNLSATLKTITEFGAAFSTVAITLGSVWVAVYFARIVHAVPTADFGKLAIAVGIIGAFGTTQIVVILFLLALPAAVTELFMAYAVTEPSDRDRRAAGIRVSQEQRLQECIAAAVAGVEGPRPIFFFAGLGVLGFLYEVAVALFGHTPLMWVLLVVASSVFGGFVAIRDERFRGCVVAGVYWGMLFPRGLQFLQYTPSLENANSLTTMATIAILATYLNAAFIFRGYFRFAVVFIVLMYLIGYGNVENILGDPIRKLNLGYDYRSLTAKTHSAAQTAKDCGLHIQPNRHFTPFVLSEFGDSYVIRCTTTHRAMEIPKTEAVHRTIAFPDAEVTPNPADTVKR